MQTSVPELTDLSKEPERTFELYGPIRESPARSPRIVCWRGGWPSAACGSSSSITARWDHHGGCPKAIRTACVQADQPSAALVQDLKQRGLLDETLVIWGGEFGRTVYSQGKLTADDYGRDHHPRAFTIWMAGGGIKPGITLGETDDYGYNITEDPVHVHDLNATILHCLGIDHTAADLQVSRPAVPPHRYRRPRRPEGAHLRRRRLNDLRLLTAMLVCT